MKEYLDLASGLLTPVIAVVAIMIAIFQYRLERQRWRLAMFDKRYPIFDHAMTFVADVVSGGTAKNVNLTQFLRDTKDGEVLFSEDVSVYLRKLYSEAARLRMHADALDPLPVGAERDRHAQAIQELNVWFGEQLDEIRRVFSAYIRIHEK